MFKKLLKQIQRLFRKIKRFFVPEPELDEYTPGPAPKIYNVTIEEILKRVVAIEATSPQEAFSKAWKRYCDKDIRLNSSDFQSVDVYIEGETPIEFYETNENENDFENNEND